MNFILRFPNLRKIVNSFKQKMSLSRDFFLKPYRLQKARLLKHLKSPVSEHLWTVNMLKVPKHCFKLHGSFFVIIFDHSEITSAPKSLL